MNESLDIKLPMMWQWTKKVEEARLSKKEEFSPAFQFNEPAQWLDKGTIDVLNLLSLPCNYHLVR